jgi:hypothetical protein
VIRKYEARLRHWHSAPDYRQAAPVNAGIASLRGADYVGWLNADDLLLPDAFRRLGGFLETHPDYVAVFGRAYIVDARGRVTGEFPTRPFTRRALARRSIICQPATLVARRAWDAVGGLDESLHMCLDYDLWWRLSELGPLGFLPEIVACSRDREATKTRAHQDRLYEEASPLLRRHLGRVPLGWCVNERAYSWRTAHGGQRAAGLVSPAICGYRALARHLRFDGLPELMRGFRAR